MPDRVDDIENISITDYDVPDGIADWSDPRMDTARDSVSWWRIGSGSLRSRYQKLTVTLLKKRRNPGFPEWKVTRTEQSEYGLTIQNTYRLKQAPVYEDGSGFESACDIVQRFMEQNPGIEPFDSEPSLPEPPGNWTAVETDSHSELVWQNEGSRITVSESGFDERYQSSTRKYDMTLEIPDVTPIRDVPSWKAVRSAVRCMEAFPENRFTVSRRSLQNVKGVGPAKAAQLQALGLTSWQDVKAAVEDDHMACAHREFQEAFDRIVNDQIRESVLSFQTSNDSACESVEGD